MHGLRRSLCSLIALSLSGLADGSANGQQLDEIIRQAPGDQGSPAQHACHVGENGAPVLADRGIGGTGLQQNAPSDLSGAGGTSSASPKQLADRGIGGTGASSESDTTKPAGGIGGTGIVGVITGFASVCINGMEVNYDPNLPVNQDGSIESANILRAGQIAVITARATGDTPNVASEMKIRHEVSGPITRSDLEHKRLIVAGQTIVLGDDVWGDIDPQEGDWVAVSGLRLPDGTIQATRLDRRLPGRVLIRGLLISDGTVHIGQMIVRVPAWAAPNIGQFVQIYGRLATDGTLVLDEVGLDSFETDPASVFPPDIQQFAIEGYFQLDAGEIVMGRRRAFIRQGMRSTLAGQRPSIVHLSRLGGHLEAEQIRHAPPQAEAISRSRSASPSDFGNGTHSGGNGPVRGNRGGPSGNDNGRPSGTDRNEGPGGLPTGGSPSPNGFPNLNPGERSMGMPGGGPNGSPHEGRR